MKIKFFTLALMLSSVMLQAQYTQIVDLSTGVVNGSSSLISVGSPDDTWTVKEPGGSTFQPVLVSNGIPAGFGAYPAGSNARWIAPHTITTPGATYGQIPSTPEHVGYYQYKMTFNVGNCNITAHPFITFTGAAADNSIEGFYLNGIYHDLVPRNISFGAVHSPFNELINVGQLAPGTNTIIFFVQNLGSFTGMYLDAKLSITYPGGNPFLSAAIAPGPATFCSGSPLTFTGSSNTPATNTYWEITESNSSGVPVSGGYSWNNWATGSPGTYTFPVSPACGKYYRIKLAVQNGCVSWYETTQVIYIECSPGANAGSDKTLCNDYDCVTIGEVGRFGFGISYQWTGPSGVIGNSQTAVVCPTTTTTYTYTVTNAFTGCSSSDYVTVNVVNASPKFSLASNLNPADNFYTLVATPTNTSAGSIPGFGYVWAVDEIVSTTNTTVITGSTAWNPYCWWNSSLTTNFNGYDGPYFTSTGLDPMTGGCGSPSIGHFTEGHTYRITRGTWSTTCAWQQYSVIAYMTHPFVGPSQVLFMEDPNAPDYSSLMPAATTGVTELAAEINISVYPNPGTGVFTVEMDKASLVNIEVYDALGKKVKALEQNGSKSVIDLTGFPKGMYMINVISKGTKTSRKIILE